MKFICTVFSGLMLLSTSWVNAQDVSVATDAAVGASVQSGDGNDGTSESNDDAALKLKVEIARAEAEKARAEAEKARAETEKARADAERVKAELALKQAAAMAPAVQTDTSVAATAVPPAAPVSIQNDEETEAQPDHRGLFLRFTPGLGLGTAWAKGTMDPRPGIVAIDNPHHTTLTGTIGFDIGAGIVKNLALHVGAFYEKMILRKQAPTTMVFSILGVDAGLTWFFTDLELYLTGQFRWVGMLLKYPEVNCSEYFKDTFEWYKGPGLSLTFGREWYDSAKDENAVGVGIQSNYYRMHGGHGKDYAFNHFSLLLVLTFTHF